MYIPQSAPMSIRAHQRAADSTSRTHVTSGGALAYIRTIQSILRRPHRRQQKQRRSSAMAALLNLIYREYCRARLAEMRRPALLLPSADASSVDPRQD
jgi:hypothetical protein